MSSALYIVHVIHDNYYHVLRVQYIEHWTPCIYLITSTEPTEQPDVCGNEGLFDLKEDTTPRSELLSSTSTKSETMVSGIKRELNNGVRYDQGVQYSIYCTRYT